MLTRHFGLNQPLWHSVLNHIQYMPSWHCLHSAVPDVPDDANYVAAGPIVPGALPSPIPLSGHISATGPPIEIERGTVSRVGAQKKVHQDKERI